MCILYIYIPWLQWYFFHLQMSLYFSVSTQSRPTLAWPNSGGNLWPCLWGKRVLDEKSLTSLWFQPIWTNISQIGSFLQVGVKIKNAWNHHLVESALHPPKPKKQVQSSTWICFFDDWKKFQNYSPKWWHFIVIYLGKSKESNLSIEDL